MRKSLISILWCILKSLILQYNRVKCVLSYVHGDNECRYLFSTAACFYLLPQGRAYQHSAWLSHFCNVICCCKEWLKDHGKLYSDEVCYICTPFFVHCNRLSYFSCSVLLIFFYIEKEILKNTTEAFLLMMSLV